ncbi:MAG: regulatory signaling modulator protein AmpE [Gammaproteobacteria bacterium]
MTLIATLLSIAIDRYFGYLHEYRHYRHFLEYVKWVQTTLPGAISNGLVGVLLTLIPVLVVVAATQIWLTGLSLGGFFSLFFSIAVMVYCLGPRDLAIDADSYCKACDMDNTSIRAASALHLTGLSEPPADTGECISRVVKAILARSNDYMFAVIFWFVLLGPVGAVLYRTLSILYNFSEGNDRFQVWATHLYSIVSWIPARMTALGYALSGHFDSAMEGWRIAHKEKKSGLLRTDYILIETGLGALDMRGDDSVPEDHQPVRSSMRLVLRTLTIWLAALSVMTLAGWAV